MYTIYTTNKFDKDYKLCLKRGLDTSLLKAAVYLLEQSGKLTPKYKTHKLRGNYYNHFECHIQPDWLLIWVLDIPNSAIYLVRTGTHSDLF